MRNKLLSLILVFCLIVPCAILLTACGSQGIDYDQLMISVNNAITYVDNESTVADLQVDEEWYIYQGVNYKYSMGLEEYLTGDENLLTMLDQWLSNEYSDEKLGVLEEYNDCYIEVWSNKANHRDFVSIYRDTGSALELLTLSSNIDTESHIDRTEISYAKCDTDFKFFYILIDNSLENELSYFYQIALDYQTLKNLDLSTFDLEDYELLDYKNIWPICQKGAMSNGEDYISYTYVFRKSQDDYIRYDFHVQYNEKGINIYNTTDEDCLMSADGIIKTYSKLIEDLYGL